MDVVREAVVEDVLLWARGMHLDLVHCGLDFGVFEQTLEVLDGEVGDACTDGD